MAASRLTSTDRSIDLFQLASARASTVYPPSLRPPLQVELTWPNGCRVSEVADRSRHLQSITYPAYRRGRCGNGGQPCDRRRPGPWRLLRRSFFQAGTGHRAPPMPAIGQMLSPPMMDSIITGHRRCAVLHRGRRRNVTLQDQYPGRFRGPANALRPRHAAETVVSPAVRRVKRLRRGCNSICRSRVHRCLARDNRVSTNEKPSAGRQHHIPVHRTSVPRTVSRESGRCRTCRNVEISRPLRLLARRCMQKRLICAGA